MKPRQTFNEAATAARSFIEGQSGGEPSPPSRDAWMCAASGCPMFGTMSDQTSGTISRRWCGWHHGAGGRHESKITSVLRNRMPVSAAIKSLRSIMARPEPIEHGHLDDIEHGMRVMPDAARFARQERNARMWLSHLEGELHRDVSAAIQFPRAGRTQ